MIEADVWLEQIRRYVRFVADEPAVRGIWVFRRKGVSSVTDFDEMIEQVFDDLDSDALETEMLAKVSDAERSRLGQFIAALRAADKAHPKVRTPVECAAFLSSPEWATLNASAISALPVLQ
jgi:hypothetical protein